MHPQIILALDLPSLSVGQEWLSKNGLTFSKIKVGLQLFCATERTKIIEFREKYPLFLDLKLHDIPNSVAGAIQSLQDIQPDFLTIHCSGGQDMIKAALEARDKYIPNTELLGVSVLTSLSDDDLRHMGIVQGADYWAIELVNMSYEAGMRHFVASVHEAAALKQQFSDITVISPGIRLDLSAQDQKRAASPAIAAKAGTDYMVIGRTLMNAADPKAVFEQITQEWYANQSDQAAA